LQAGSNRRNEAEGGRATLATQEILVLGGGFAGLWAAVGAARKLDELKISADQVRVTLVNRDAFHSIRVRNYENDLSNVRVPLADVLEPIGVRLRVGEVASIDPGARQATVAAASKNQLLQFDRLVFALGSQLVRPPLPGLAETAFDVDTYAGAVRLAEHLQTLAERGVEAGVWTVLVVGAGLTGIETACEMPARLKSIQKQAGIDAPIRVILADHSDHIGSTMGDSARPVIGKALTALGVETRTGVRVARIDESGTVLDSGERIAASTVIWCAGMRASPLAKQLGSPVDQFGRVTVDEHLKVQGLDSVFAAGDVAAMKIDGQHEVMMSCQHGRPMGRFAGHNVVCDLLNLPMFPLQIDWYVTVLDLGPWGAVYTNGWDRHVVACGERAKRTKQTINCVRIYPPRSRNRAEILAAAAPVVQAPPDYEP
jgi:NADH dehydrogenase